MSPRIDEARVTVQSLLDDLENSRCPIDAVLMKAKRLARLMRDADAQEWLDLETRGYPQGFSFEKLGTCSRYAIASGRVMVENSKYYTQSLSEFEANAASDEALLESLRQSRGHSASAKDFVEKNATEALMASLLKVHANQKKALAHSKSLFASLKAGIHGYATDTYLAIELGDIAQDIFEAARDAVDAFVRSHCPHAAEKLVAINERMTENSSESRTSALTSCRRLLMVVADSLFPPRDTDWVDASGKPHKVGADQYKNRLLAYLSEAAKSRGSFHLVEADLEHLAARIDAIYEKTCKGVHVDVSESEARLAVIHTYLFIGELAQCSKC
jgi:hypothetical protein